VNSLDRAIDDHAEEAFVLLEELVACQSVVGFEQEAQEVFARAAVLSGLVVERLPFPSEPWSDQRAGVTQPEKADQTERYQVVASSPGTGPLTLLLNGHIDVVPASTPELWTSPPFASERRDGKLFGRGAGDMKSGLAMGILAIRALMDVRPGLFSTKRLGFIAVIEEECTGNGALHSIANQGITAPEVLLLEPTDLGVLLGGVGVLWVHIDVLAFSAHAYASHDHANAIDLGMRVVEALRGWCNSLDQSHVDASLDPDSSPYNLNVGKVHSGDWTSSAPSTATFDIRVGFPRGWSASEAEAAVRKVIHATAANDPQFPSQPVVTSSGLRAEGYLEDSDSPLVRDLSVAHRDAHGELPRLFSLGSTTDARTYVNNFGLSAACFGAVAYDMHGIDESVELQSIVDGARTLARFLLLRFGESENEK
jgi:acetylornithine deacetylase